MGGRLFVECLSHKAPNLSQAPFKGEIGQLKAERDALLDELAQLKAQLNRISASGNNKVSRSLKIWDLDCGMCRSLEFGMWGIRTLNDVIWGRKCDGINGLEISLASLLL